MKCKDKRCAICKQVFTPTNGRQLYCEECMPYVRTYRTEKRARIFRQADARVSGTPLSSYPAAEGCNGCNYWRLLGGTGGEKACHYLIDTGRRRPCLPGKNCTVRIQKKRGETVRKNFSLH